VYRAKRRLCREIKTFFPKCFFFWLGQVLLGLPSYHDSAPSLEAFAHRSSLTNLKAQCFYWIIHGSSFKWSRNSSLCNTTIKKSWYCAFYWDISTLIEYSKSNKLHQLLRLYNVGDKWVKFGRGALLEWYWLGKSQIPEKDLSQYHYVYHKPHVEWPGIELLPPRYEAGGQPPKQWHGSKQNKKRLGWHYMCSGRETENILLWSLRPLVLTLNLCWRR
jgi:hypothetical protein